MASGQEQLTRQQYKDTLMSEKMNDHDLLIDNAMQLYDLNIKFQEICDNSPNSASNKKQTGFNVATVANSFLSAFNTLVFWINNRGGM
jgi:hypothetical protein